MVPSDDAWNFFLKEAMDNGSRPHVAFPDINKTYTSTKLFGPFSRRLHDPRRPDYSERLKELGLSPKPTEMEVLRATGGILATDSYEFVTPIFIDEDYFALDFFIAGWRYYDGERVIHQLKVGDTVHFLLENDNDKDNRAVIVMSMNGEKLGYIPAFYSGWMYEILKRNCDYKVRVVAIHPQAVPHRKVRISVVSINIQEVLLEQEDLLLVM